MYLKSILTLFFFITLITNITSQLEDSKKGELYFYWGWNKGKPTLKSSHSGQFFKIRCI